MLLAYLLLIKIMTTLVAYQWEWIPYDKETWEMLTDKTRTKNDN